MSGRSGPRTRRKVSGTVAGIGVLAALGLAFVVLPLVLATARGARRDVAGVSARPTAAGAPVLVALGNIAQLKAGAEQISSSNVFLPPGPANGVSRSPAVCSSGSHVSSITTRYFPHGQPISAHTCSSSSREPSL